MYVAILFILGAIQLAAGLQGKTLCSPDIAKHHMEKGICSSTDELDEKCQGKELLPSTRDCGAFEGNWCCYVPRPVPRVAIKRTLNGDGIEVLSIGNASAQSASEEADALESEGEEEEDTTELTVVLAANITESVKTTPLNVTLAAEHAILAESATQVAVKHEEAKHEEVQKKVISADTDSSKHLPSTMLAAAEFSAMVLNESTTIATTKVMQAVASSAKPKEIIAELLTTTEAAKLVESSAKPKEIIAKLLTTTEAAKLVESSAKPKEIIAELLATTEAAKLVESSAKPKEIIAELTTEAAKIVAKPVASSVIRKDIITELEKLLAKIGASSVKKSIISEAVATTEVVKLEASSAKPKEIVHELVATTDSVKLIATSEKPKEIIAESLKPIEVFVTAKPTTNVATDIISQATTAVAALESPAKPMNESVPAIRAVAVTVKSVVANDKIQKAISKSGKAKHSLKTVKVAAELKTATAIPFQTAQKAAVLPAVSSDMSHNENSTKATTQAPESTSKAAESIVKAAQIVDHMAESSTAKAAESTVKAAPIMEHIAESSTARAMESTVKAAQIIEHVAENSTAKAAESTMKAAQIMEHVIESSTAKAAESIVKAAQIVDHVAESSTAKAAESTMKAAQIMEHVIESSTAKAAESTMKAAQIVEHVIESSTAKAMESTVKAAQIVEQVGESSTVKAAESTGKAVHIMEHMAEATTKKEAESTIKAAEILDQVAETTTLKEIHNDSITILSTQKAVENNANLTNASIKHEVTKELAAILETSTKLAETTAAALNATLMTALKETVIAKNVPVLCRPDGLKSFGKHGQCVSTIDLDDKCSDKEISSSGDHCADFDGHWCCYDNKITTIRPEQKLATTMKALESAVPLNETVTVKNETVLCTPDGMKSVGKHGQCVNTIDLNDKCSDTEISASEDHCAKFDGHWCCYVPLPRAHSALKINVTLNDTANTTSTVALAVPVSKMASEAQEVHHVSVAAELNLIQQDILSSNTSKGVEKQNSTMHEHDSEESLDSSSFTDMLLNLLKRLQLVQT